LRRSIINADAADLLVEFAELTGVPVIPTLMGWGTISDDHPLMAGLAGLQTAHRYGNATLLASTSCWVSATAGRTATPVAWTPTARAARSCTSTSSRPRSVRVFAPDYALSPTQGRVGAVRRGRPRAQWTLPDRPAGRPNVPNASAPCQRKTHFETVPVKPQRVYEEMNRSFGPDTRYVTTIGLSQIAAAQFTACVPSAGILDQRRAGRPAGLDPPSRARRVRGRTGGDRRRTVRRLRLPVP